jgi:hypothetical protein
MLLIVWTSSVTGQSKVDDGSPAEVRTGAISGRVLTENGQPLENVPVSIRAWNVNAQPGTTTTTDSQGRFQVSGLEPALYTVVASAPGYARVLAESGGQPSFYRIGDSVTITLIKGGIITGTVTSASGEPLIMTGVRAILIRDEGGQKSAVPQTEKMTDDRGVYRLYGLQPGTYLVSTGGRLGSMFHGNAYETDLPTYAPSSNRETAQEISLRSGEERSGVDIRSRAESVHTVSGTVHGLRALSGDYAGARILLTEISNGVRMGGLRASQAPGSQGFSLSEVTDGEYEVTGLTALGPNEIAISEPRRITVKGADVTGVELITKPLGSICGHLVLENSTALECKDKRKPLLAETLVLIQNNSKGPNRNDPRMIWFTRPVTPDKSGDFLFSNLVAGEFRFELQFSAKYWYLKKVSQPAAVTPTSVAKSVPASRPNEARNWIGLKQGDRLSGLAFTLAEGAGSLRGGIKLAGGERIPEQLYLHLVPTEQENVEDALRYFATAVNADRTFALGSLPPGRYWVLVRVSEDKDTKWIAKLRLPEETETRMKLRKEAEAARTEIELKPCQNIINYQWSFKPR